MNTVTVRLKIVQGKNGEFIQTIRSLQEKLKQEEGFSKCTVYQDTADDSTFNMIEEWQTQDYLDNHLRSDLFRILIGALKVLSEECDVSYHLVAEKRGTKEIDIK